MAKATKKTNEFKNISKDIEKYVKFLTSLSTEKTEYKGHTKDGITYLVKYSNDYECIEVYCDTMPIPIFLIEDTEEFIIDSYTYNYLQYRKTPKLTDLPAIEYEDFIKITKDLIKTKVTSVADISMYYFNRIIQKKGWGDIENFITFRFFPKYYMFSKMLKQKNSKDDFYIKNVRPLLEFFELIENRDKSIAKVINDFSEEPLNIAFYNLINALKQKNKTYINRLIKEWDDRLNEEIPESVIYSMAFPNDETFENPIPLRVSNIEKQLGKNNCFSTKRGIQKLCDKMHIQRDKTKCGRIPTEK